MKETVHQEVLHNVILIAGQVFQEVEIEEVVEVVAEVEEGSGGIDKSLKCECESQELKFRP